MTRPGRLLVLALLACAAPLLGWSCDRGTLTVHVVRSVDPAEEPLPAPPEVASLRVRVEGGGMGLVERTFPYQGRGSKVELPEIPVGRGRVVTVEGLDANGSAYSRGSSIPLEVRAGNNYINLYVGRVQHFSRTPVDLREARAFHAAVVLADSRVVLVGGAASVSRSAEEPLAVGGARATSEVLDATSASFDTSALDCGVALPRDCLGKRRALATATALSTGVLVAGGEDDDGRPLPDAELYDVGRRLFLPGGTLTGPRSRHAAVALGEGAVLLGGRDGAGAIGGTETFADGRFTAGPAIAPRESATATVLLDGRVLVVGGRDPDRVEVATAEIVDGGTVTAVGSLTQPRAFHTATLLPDGRVLVLGGLAGGAAVEVAEVYDPATNAFATVEATLRDRWAHAAVAMSDGRILVTGGFGGGTFGGARPDAEILDASSLQRGSGTLAGLAVTNLGGIMTTGRAGHSASLLGNGLVLLAGGVGASDVALASAEVFVVQR
jgi:hypothetical protein